MANNNNNNNNNVHFLCAITLYKIEHTADYEHYNYIDNYIDIDITPKIQYR